MRHTIDIQLQIGIIVSFDLSLYFLFFWNLHTTFHVNGIIPSL